MRTCNHSTENDLKPLAVTIQKAAPIIGVSSGTIRRLIDDGMLSTTRVYGRVLVRYSSIEDLLNESTGAEAA